MSKSWLADNQGDIKLTDKLLPGFWLTLLLLFGINTILAVSLNITIGWANFFSIGHGGIMGKREFSLNRFIFCASKFRRTRETSDSG